jgi:HEAT repeat protein
VPALTEGPRDPDAQLRALAAQSLGQIGPDQNAVKLLAEALADPSLRLAALAATALALTPAADRKSALPALVKAVDDPDPQLALPAALAVLQADPAHAAARGVLKNRLATVLKHLVQVRRRPQQPPARGEAIAWIAGLEALGPDARSAVPLLKHLGEKDSDQEVRRRATQALKAINTPPRQPGNGSN